jgi:hypothetical protein
VFSTNLVGIQQRALGRWRQRGGGIGALRPGFRQALFGVAGNRRGVGPGAAQGLVDRLDIEHHAQQVKRVDVGVAVFDGELRGTGQHLVRVAAEQPGDIDGAPEAAGALALQVARQEVLERAVAGAGWAKECWHVSS